ncbi:hypothetical protein [Solidesulfovibrio sp.]|jgi:hypothetical protein|uniref:hypothetical protein n=1 Tax=Solidesulfovibrio sp. TaxID=2910990 RepID=UPI000ED1B561|nr:hypothetical protein [Solidesulfovibrio sp.]MEA5088132.1 hypothetical protein [Solidesulfovibrio sp.]HCR13686.1 hypothetical protein [Desulfovibrio sp.]HML62718.1 hypothetical protein [Solidesulfovibrio sp.]
MDALEPFPALRSRERIVSWLTQEAARIRALDTAALAGCETFSLVPGAKSSHHCGWEEDAGKFVLALLAADWACYAQQAHREDYAHLKLAVSVFPKGFRLWLARLEGRCVPVGYTGFHPIAEPTFSLLKHSPESITSRERITPEPESFDCANYLYLYNISIIKPFRKSHVSRMLLRTLVEDMASVPSRGLAAIAVSPDGERVIERFGLRKSGCISHDGQKEMAYTSEETDTCP